MLLSSILFCAFCNNVQEIETKSAQTEQGECSVPAKVSSTTTSDPTKRDKKSEPNSVATNKQTFAQIKSKGLDNACYPDTEHYLAEYLFQNPQACLWDVDNTAQTISTVSIPEIPANAVMLPLPSGGDDTSALEKIINENEGGAVYGSGTYKVNGLKIKVPVDIFDMPMKPMESANRAVIIDSADVRIFNSSIDAHNSAVTSTGFYVDDGSHGFVLINSGFSNIHHRRGNNAAGVVIKGANDFHIACNNFENIINNTSDKTKTARANAILMNGSNTQHTSGGVIANNTTRELQSNGKIQDSEFFTIQSYNSTDSSNPVRIYANRNTNAGKRLAKLQESNALILSNQYEWRDKQGPLGSRLLYAMINVQFSDNIIARNNRLKVGADGRFDYIFHTNAKWSNVEQTNLHFDCNDIEIQDELAPSSNNISHIIAARNDALHASVTDAGATKSSANNNIIHGKGSVSFHYWFGPGYDNQGEGFDTDGNDFKVPFLNSVYKHR